MLLNIVGSLITLFAVFVTVFVAIFGWQNRELFPLPATIAFTVFFGSLSAVCVALLIAQNQ